MTGFLNQDSSIPYTVASFFSGIGGFDLGFQNAGFEVAVQCEIDTFCNQILQQHWPNVPKYKDIRELDHAVIPASDVWVGGFPCQDVSVARMGPRAGLRGKRSGLFYRFAELISKCLPRIIVIENVTGLLSSHGGRDFQIIIRTLADLGYTVGWRVLNSRYFGVPQSRQRVYIVGCYRDQRGTAEILFEPECSSGNVATRKQNGEGAISPFKTSFGDPSTGPLVPGIAYCLYACSARHTGTDWSRTYVTYPEGRVRRLIPVECEGIQGFPINWTLPNNLHNLPEDIEKLDTLRYTALGNAVSVPVVQWLAERIIPVLQRYQAEAVAVNLASANLHDYQVSVPAELAQSLAVIGQD